MWKKLIRSFQLFAMEIFAFSAQLSRSLFDDSLTAFFAVQLYSLFNFQYEFHTYN